MQEQINQRLAELDREFKQGNARLKRLEGERAELRETLLRIQGAVLVLKELAAVAGEQEPAGNQVGETAEICIPVAAGAEAVDNKYPPQSTEE